MGRTVLIAAQLLATVLFIINFQQGTSPVWFAWAVPMLLVVLVVINSLWFTRFVSWIIFGTSFFSFLIILSAFTIRWRLEPGFSSTPFYLSMLMYVAFVYVALGQIKILGRR